MSQLAEKKYDFKKIAKSMGFIIITILLNSLISFWMVNSQRPTIATFGMKKTIDTFFDNVAQKELTEEQGKLLAERFTRTLDQVLSSYQQKNNVVILVSPAVVSGAPDITIEIQKQVAKKMREIQ